MLPFLAKIRQRDNSEIVTRSPDEGKEPEQNHGLAACAQSLIDSIHNKDAKGAAQAFQDMFTICESQPHEEYSDEQDTE